MLSQAETAELLKKHPDFKKDELGLEGVWKHKTGACIADGGYFYWLVYFALKGHVSGPPMTHVVTAIYWDK